MNYVDTKEDSKFPLNEEETRMLHGLLDKLAEQGPYFTCNLGYGKIELHAIMPPSEYYKCIG